jgi:hypothetical protein
LGRAYGRGGAFGGSLSLLWLPLTVMLRECRAAVLGTEANDRDRPEDLGRGEIVIYRLGPTCLPPDRPSKSGFAAAVLRWQ